MALNEELDRLGVAEDYLLEYAATTQEFDAALEHVLLIARTKPEYRLRCEQIIKNVVSCRRDDQQTMKKLRSRI